MTPIASTKQLQFHDKSFRQSRGYGNGCGIRIMYHIVAFSTIELFIAVSPSDDSLLFLGKSMLSEIIVFDCVPVDHGDKLF